jgi:Zn-dependent M28 family amino/carboxypeptidase
MRGRSAFVSVVVLATMAATALTVVPAVAAPTASCDRRTNNTIGRLLQCVTLAGVREHQAAFQEIADDNGGNRFAGLPGHDASVEYVVDRLEAAGYDPELQAFDYLAFGIIGPSALAQTAPGSVTYVEGTDFAVMDQSDPGDVTAAVTPVDIVLAPPRAPVTSGCDGAFATDADGNTVPDPGGPDDFVGFPAGNIALIQRGTCTFETKAANADAAGAVGAIIFNQGNTPEREVLLENVTLGASNASGIPVVGTSFARGEEWANTPGLTMHLFTNVVRQTETTFNVLAELPGSNADNVVMVGGHLDSVSAGPGINDNGSGSAAILDVAEAMAKVRPVNTVRFAWWSAEESGLVGSEFYVNSLSQAERDRIALYLNFDMIGSPNYVRFVYDGDGTIGPEGPPGSGAIEDLFVGFYEDRGLESEPTAFDGRSDYGPFIASGVDIPAGGLFTGAEGIKTAAQRDVYGGIIGQQYDPCYHEACDTFSNNSNEVLDLNSDAIAFATLTYAMDTSSVTGP